MFTKKNLYEAFQAGRNSGHCFAKWYHELVKTDTYGFGDFEFDPVTRKLTLNSVSQILTEKESGMLEILAKNLNKTVTRNELLVAVWGHDNVFNTRSMDVFLLVLRKRLKADPSVMIMNERGTGFKLLTDVK